MYTYVYTRVGDAFDPGGVYFFIFLVAAPDEAFLVATPRRGILDFRILASRTTGSRLHLTWSMMRGAFTLNNEELRGSLLRRESFPTFGRTRSTIGVRHSFFNTTPQFGSSRPIPKSDLDPEKKLLPDERSYGLGTQRESC